MNKICYSFIFALFLVTACSEEEAPPCKETTWFQDLDNDGEGNANISVKACDQPAGYVGNATDTNDNLNNAEALIPKEGYSTPASYANRTLIWSDEFSGDKLDEKYWNYETGNNGGWGNNELQNYTKENTQVKDGHLIITAKKESLGGFGYTSSRLTTQNKFDFKYGRVDIRAALPKGQGIWPALWMLGKNFSTVGWPKCGEIDIMEMIGGTADGRDNTVHGTVHWDNAGSYANYGGSYKNAGPLHGKFHVFSLEWNAKEIIWYIDDIKYHVIDISPAGLDEFQKEFFLIFNVAVGGNWPGSPDPTTNFPQNMVVDYVRVFQ